MKKADCFIQGEITGLVIFAVLLFFASYLDCKFAVFPICIPFLVFLINEVTKNGQHVKK